MTGPALLTVSAAGDSPVPEARSPDGSGLTLGDWAGSALLHAAVLAGVLLVARQVPTHTPPAPPPPPQDLQVLWMPEEAAPATAAPAPESSPRPDKSPPDTSTPQPAPTRQVRPAPPDAERARPVTAHVPAATSPAPALTARALRATSAARAADRPQHHDASAGPQTLETAPPSAGGTHSGGSVSAPALRSTSESAGHQGAATPARWTDLLQARVRQLRRYPALAERLQQQGQVVVQVRLAADGALLGCEVVEGSGTGILDEAALELVRRAVASVRSSVGGPGTPLQRRVPVIYRLE